LLYLYPNYQIAIMPDSVTILTIEYKNQQPVELTDLTSSLTAISNQYKRFVKSHALINPEEGVDVKLYIKEMKSGSIIADLIDQSYWILPLLSDTNTLYEFGKSLKDIIDYLLGNFQQKPELTKQEYHDIAAIVEPIAKDNASQINVSTTNNIGEVHYHLHLNSQESNAIQNKASKEIEALLEPKSREQRGVVLYWYQARGGDLHSTPAGDRAIIESISNKPVKVFFAEEHLKGAMVLSENNPFTYAYLVDVSVETINGSPILYRVTALHDRIERNPPLGLTTDSALPE